MSRGRDEIGDGDGVVVKSCSDEACVVGHIDHEDGSDFLGDFGEFGVVDFAWVSRGSGDDHFGFVFAGQFFDLIEVDAVIIGADAVMNSVVEFAGEVQEHAVSQVTAVREVHGEEGIAWFHDGHEDGHVGLRACVGLDVGVLGSEELAGTFAGEVFDDVDMFAAAVIASSGVAFGVFIGQDGADGFLDGCGGVVFRGDEFQTFDLTSHLGLNGRENLGIDLFNGLVGREGCSHRNLS